MADNHSCNQCRYVRPRIWHTMRIRWPLCLTDPDQWVCNSPKQRGETRSRVTGKTRRGELPRCRDKTCNEPCKEWKSKLKPLAGPLC